MAALFILDLTTDAATRRCAFRTATASTSARTSWRSTRTRRRRGRACSTRGARGADEGRGGAPAQLATLGQLLGEQVLDGGIAARLDQRRVLVRLPDPTGDNLAAAFARVPWEIARAPGVDGTLLDRNVVVRAAPAGMEPARETAIPVEAGKPVRVLLVFAEAPGRTRWRCGWSGSGCGSCSSARCRRRGSSRWTCSATG